MAYLTLILLAIGLELCAHFYTVVWGFILSLIWLEPKPRGVFGVFDEWLTFGQGCEVAGSGVRNMTVNCPRNNMYLRTDHCRSLSNNGTWSLQANIH